MSLLSNQQTLSSPACLLLALAKIQLTDLQALGGSAKKGQSVTDFTLKAYTEAHDTLLNQVSVTLQMFLLILSMMCCYFCLCLFFN